jgi:hypothetical protein
VPWARGPSPPKLGFTVRGRARVRVRVRVRVGVELGLGVELGVGSGFEARAHRELRVVGDRLGRGGTQVPLHVPGYHGY